MGSRFVSCVDPYSAIVECSGAAWTFRGYTDAACATSTLETTLTGATAASCDNGIHGTQSTTYTQNIRVSCSTYSASVWLGQFHMCEHTQSVEPARRSTEADCVLSLLSLLWWWLPQEVQRGRQLPLAIRVTRPNAAARLDLPSPALEDL